LNESVRNRVIALAGIIQSAWLVDLLAREGNIPHEHYDPLIASLFEFNPQDVESVYGGLSGVRKGLELLKDMLDRQAMRKHREVMRYAIGAMQLAKQLSRNQAMQKIVRNRLEHASLKSAHFSTHRDDTATSIAAVYKDTLSTFRFRVQVTGSAEHLKTSRIADNIRALLFAGVRAAMLWRQVGGSRWQFLWQKRLLQHTCAQLLAECLPETES
jgi:high frequency lysogenization protein